MSGSAFDLNPLPAEGAWASMRERFQNPQLSAGTHLLCYESQDFLQTTNLLRPYHLINYDHCSRRNLCGTPADFGALH